MTGILVTKFKMGQINVKDLEQMATDATRAERCSAAKKVLVCERLAGSSPSAGHPPDIRSSASKTLKAGLQTSSSFSTPTFLTMGFQILSFIQAGAPLGLST